MRLLVITPRNPLGVGGVERHVLETTTRLAAAGVEVDVLYGETEHRSPVEQHLGGVRLRAVRARPRGRDWYWAPGLWREMARHRADLVHVQSYHTLVAPLAMLRARTLGLPYCLTFHAGGHSSRWRVRLRSLQLLALRPLLVRAARLVALARFEIGLYSSSLGLPEGRFVLIPNGVEVPRELEELEGEPKRDVIASIGRLERYKGHHRVIEALPGVLEQRPEARLMIVGTGPYEGELRRLAARLDLADRVEFTSVPAGDGPAMARLLGQVAIVVLMSEFETHPLAALEAAAARRRLLVSDCGGLRELAGQGLARAAALPMTPRELAQLILEELAKPPPQHAPELPSWDECAASLLELYRAVLAEDAPA